MTQYKWKRLRDIWGLISERALAGRTTICQDVASFLGLKSRAGAYTDYIKPLLDAGYIRCHGEGAWEAVVPLVTMALRPAEEVRRG